MRVKVTEIYVCIYVVIYTAAAAADDDDDLGVLGPFQHYLNHIETIEGW